MLLKEKCASLFAIYVNSRCFYLIEYFYLIKYQNIVLNHR